MKLVSPSIGTIENYFKQRSEFKKLFILLLAGLSSALSFAPVYFFPSYMIALPILLVFAMSGKNLPEAFKFGYIFGFGHFFAGLYWIGNSVAVEPTVPDWTGYLMVALLSSILAIFIGLVAFGVKYIHKKHNFNSHMINIVISFVVLWSVAEWLRGVVFTGFPWNLTGYIWGFSDVMLQTTAIWGVYGLGIITAFLAFIPFLMLDKKYRLLAPSIAAFVIGGGGYYGNDRMPENTEFVEGVNLRIVQPNIKQQDKWPVSNWGKNLVTYMGMSDDEQLAGTTHVIWPETAVIYSLSEEPFRRQLLSKILGEGGNLLTGFPRRQRGEGRTKIYNSFAAINDQGAIAGIYDKSHLVPFGEYIPAFVRNILIPLGLDQVFTGGQGFNEGEGVKTLNIPGLPPFGVLICYEIIFPGQVVDINNRPDWLLKYYQ